MEGFTVEKLSASISVCVSPAHRFGVDAFLLTDFAGVRAGDTACDLGTGCGIIPLLFCRNGSPRAIYAVDIQPDAIRQLEESIALSGLKDVVFPVCADLRELPPSVPHGLSLVTCNPPYYPAGSGLQSKTPSGLAARHEVLCTVGDVCRAAARLLKYGGRLCLCQRPERLCDVLEAMRQSGVEPKRLRFVANTAGAEPWLCLIEGRRGGKPGLRVLPTLPVRGEGGFSRELLDVYGFESNRPERE